MTDEEIFKKYDWYTSQFKFHYRKYKNTKNKWHRTQTKFYDNARNTIPGLFNAIVRRSFKKMNKKLTENVLRHNVLFKRLNSNNP